jgi:hypothetical protein
MRGAKGRRGWAALVSHASATHPRCTKRGTVPSGAGTEVGPCIDACDPPAQVVAPGQHVPDPARHTQDPLPDRHVGEHAVNEVRGPFGHAPTAATRAEASPFAGKRDEPLGLAVATPEAREATSQEPAPQEGPKLVLDEARQPVTVPEPDRFGPGRGDAVPPASIDEGYFATK